jgi:hypothetical protein
LRKPYVIWRLLMQSLFRILLFWTLVLSACSTGGLSPQTVAPSITAASSALPTTAIPANPQECGYQWAYEDLPELSSNFQHSIQALQPEASANAFAFGENCIRTDGSITFLAKETDFNITLQVDDLANESDLGGWSVKVMQVIENVPQEQIVGSQSGLVTIMFQSDSDQDVINFNINQYQALPSDLSNAEIYQALQAPQ